MSSWQARYRLPLILAIAYAVGLLPVVNWSRPGETAVVLGVYLLIGAAVGFAWQSLSVRLPYSVNSLFRSRVGRVVLLALGVMELEFHGLRAIAPRVSPHHTQPFIFLTVGLSVLVSVLAYLVFTYRSVAERVSIERQRLIEHSTSDVREFRTVLNQATRLHERALPLLILVLGGLLGLLEVIGLFGELLTLILALTTGSHPGIGSLGS